MLLPVLAHRLCQRVDIGRIIWIITDEFEGWLPVQLPEHGHQVLVTGRGGRHRVLWVQRQHHQLFDSGVTQQAQHRQVGRVAVTHYQIDVRPFQQFLLQRLPLAVGVGQQRRALLAPDAAVGLQRLAAAQRQDDAVQQR